MRCMNCGKMLADKWLEYNRRLKELKGADYGKRTYFDGGVVPKTAEATVLNELVLDKYCCKKSFITQEDTIQKL